MGVREIITGRWRARKLLRKKRGDLNRRKKAVRRCNEELVEKKEERVEEKEERVEKKEERVEEKEERVEEKEERVEEKEERVEEDEKEENVEEEELPSETETEEDDEWSDEEEEEEEEEEEHSQLLSAISDLSHQKRRSQRNEATPTVSQFQVSSGETVKVGGLLKGLESSDMASLKRQLATDSRHQLLPVATSQQVEKRHRGVAYSSACREVGRWLPIVNQNRKSSHLSFPLQEETVPLPSLSSQSENFKSVTELERAVEGVLKRNESVVEANEVELTAAERAELVKVMEEEGRERVKENRRWRMLMSQYEAKCQRERKIKSRRFHKVQRRRKEKAKEKEGGEEEEEEEGEDEKAERLRARERMTLKHSRQGKWAREMLSRGKRNPATQAALSEANQRKKVLTQHKHASIDEEEEDNSSSSRMEEERNLTEFEGEFQNNPWLSHSMNSDPQTTLNAENVVMESQNTDCDTTQLLITSGNERETPPPDQSDDITSSTKQQPHSTRKRSSGPVIDPSNYLTTTEKRGVALGVANDQLLRVHEAFAGDDVVREFEREKREAEKEEEKEELQLELPGWGIWGGEGVERKTKKIKCSSPLKIKKHRSDREPGHVIVGNRSNTRINKHLVKKLPWPYSTREQFRRVQATPLGRQWNSETVHRRMITPRIETKVGVAIPPLKLTDDVKDVMKRNGERYREMRGRERDSLTR